MLPCWHSPTLSHPMATALRPRLDTLLADWRGILHLHCISLQRPRGVVFYSCCLQCFSPMSCSKPYFVAAVAFPLAPRQMHAAGWVEETHRTRPTRGMGSLGHGDVWRGTRAHDISR